MAIAVQPDYTAQQEEGILLVASAEDLKVTDQASLDAAGEMLKNIKAYQKAVIALTDPAVKAGKAAHDAALRLRSNLIDKADEAEKILKYGATGNSMAPAPTSIAGFQRAQKAAADAAKAEIDRVQREAEKEAAARAKATGQPVQAVVTFTAPPPAVPKAAGLAFTDAWGFEIIDPAAIPAEYKIIDEKRIGAVVRALKGQTNIPGIRVFCGTGVRA